ncbi:MAG: helix-turn-helix domain-containing protein [Patescibacteria group bacterium]
MIEQKLKEIGLSEKEVAVYLCILQYQKISPSRVATVTTIHRPTVYSVAKELIRKGLIAEDETGTVKYLVSLGEDAFENLTKDQEYKIANIKKELPGIITTLKQIPKQGAYSIPKIRFIEESRLREFLISQSAVWAKSGAMADNIWWGFQDHTLLENYEDWANHFWTRFPKNIKLNLLTNKKPVETKIMSKKAYAPQRHIKYWGGGSEFTATHVIIGEYVLMIMTREHPHYLIEIHDKAMAQNSRHLFKSIWNLI